MPRLIGSGLAKELIYIGRMVKAEEALSMGYVNKVKGIKVGDTLTVIAVKTTYKEKPQLSNDVYFNHKSAE